MEVIKMNKWNYEKLEEMTQTQNEFTKTKLNYKYIAENYKEIIRKTHTNGDVIPLAFKDVELTYNGKIQENIKLPTINQKTQEKIEEKENQRQIMHIKHFSRSISHEAWFNFLDEEIKKFTQKYPEYKKVIL